MAVPTVRTVNAKNQSYLAEAASSEAGWRRYLETLSRHTGCANAFYNLSAMNCAGLAASDWHECREILPISTWKSLFPGADIKAAEGCTGVYGVKSRPRGSGGGLFFVDELFPPALLVGLPPTRLRGAARVLDLSVDIAAASWSDAKAGLYRLVNVADMDNDAEAVPEAERVPVAWDDLDENTRFVIEAHFRAQGPGCASPVPPPDDVRAKASSLKGYVNGIVKTAAPLIKQMRSGYRAAFERHRREVIPTCDPGRDNGRDVAPGGIAGKAGAFAEAPSPACGDRSTPVETRKDGDGLHADAEGLAREPIENAMRAIGRHSRAGDDGAGAETADCPAHGLDDGADAIGHHFARKDGDGRPSRAAARGGRHEGADAAADASPETPPAPVRAAKQVDTDAGRKPVRDTAGDPGGAMAEKEGGRLDESRTQAHERRRDRIGRHGRPSERGADDGGEIDVRRPHGRRYRREDIDCAGGNGPERHAMRRRDTVAKPEPKAPPEKYYPHGRPPRETAGHAKSAAARTAKARGKKKKPPTGKGST